MKIVNILFAGAMFSSAIFAQQGDPGAAARFQMKFGRSTISEQADRKSSPAVTSDQKMDHATCDCCHHKHA